MSDHPTLPEILGNENSLVFQIPLGGPMRNVGKNRPSICFTTMCKNEEHCIKDTLESIVNYIDYWVVYDTGSTDDTLGVIQDFFIEKNIPGKLYQEEWQGFDKSKTEMFKKAKGICDYILHIDADDLIVGDLIFTNADAGKDQYYFNTKRGVSDYKSIVLWNGQLEWKWCGVAHTTVKCLNPPKNGVKVADLSDRPFYLHSRDTGSRSHDPEKYYKDALRLKKQFWDTIIDDPDSLNTRSIFYCAQSYFDSHYWKEAAQWYSLYTKLTKTWYEERYESFMRIAFCLQQLKDLDNPMIIKCFETAINIIPERAEAYYHLGHFYNKQKKWDLGYKYLKTAYDKDHDYCQKKYVLFVNKRCYGKWVCDELSVSCYWLGKIEEGIGYLQSILTDSDFEQHKDRLQRNLAFFEKLKNKEQQKVQEEK
tara:strand:- start:152 stop:1417 length:1266 start_codon:yes stop_codon:yes gene_type:complete